MIWADAFEAAKRHARAQYPRESCGLIVAGRYLPCDNLAAPPETHRAGDPDCGCQLCSFRIAGHLFVEHHGRIDCVVHSHPDGPIHPSRADAEAQIASGLTWAMIALDAERISEPVIWGDDAPMAPILGRSFVHFAADCYTLIRDAFAFGRDGLAAQDIDGWPYPSIFLPDFPRDDGWWQGEADFYNTEPFKIGFTEIPREQARAGDVFLMSIRSPKLNHGGVLVSNGLIMHHLPNRLSRREPAGLWARQVKRWLRYTGEIRA